MTSSSNRHAFSVAILLHIIHVALSFPAISEGSPLDTDSSQGNEIGVLSSHLLQRNKRAIIPTSPTLPPDIAAHMGVVIPRRYAYVHKPAIVYPVYYYPRYYIRVPRFNHYPSPKSELFRPNDPGNYINNLLPIFKKETPEIKEQIPAFPSDPVTGNGPNGMSGGSLNDPLSANFPFWNQQANQWLWPDGIETGALPKADVMRSENKPKSTLFSLSLKDPKAMDFLLQAPSVGTAPQLSDILMASASPRQTFDPFGNSQSAGNQL